MPLVNRVQIPQDLGVKAQPTYPAVPQDVFKMAGADAALRDLGLLSPEDMEKDAILGAVAGLGRGLWGLGKGLWGVGGKALGAVAKPVGGAGNWAVQRGGTALGASPGRIKQIQGLGKGMATEAVGFGALSGGINAAMADPGERGTAFMKGFGSGALGGLAWRGAGNVASAGLKRGLGKHFTGVEAASQNPVFSGTGGFGQRAKAFGSKALLGGVPFAAGMGASLMTPTFEEPEGGHAAGLPQRAAYTARNTVGAYPQHPMGYNYNPNLPMPQYGQ